MCLVPLPCQSSPSLGSWHPLFHESCRHFSWWVAAMFSAGPARSGALRGLGPFSSQGAPAQSFNHLPLQSHQFSACFYFGPPVFMGWVSKSREWEKSAMLPVENMQEWEVSSTVPSKSQRQVKGFIVWHLILGPALSVLSAFKATLTFGFLSKSDQLPKGIFSLSAVISGKSN